MSDPDDFYNDSEPQISAAAGRVIVAAWIFFAGAALGWILHKAIA